jgi:hypothetical protein
LAGLLPPAALSGPGITMATSATIPLKYMNVQDTDLMTLKLIGIDIYSKQYEEIGKIPISSLAMARP